MAKARVTFKAGLNVRAKKTKKSEVVRVMPHGHEFEYEANNAGWLKLEDGWCMAEFTEPVEEDEPEQAEEPEQDPAE